MSPSLWCIVDKWERWRRGGQAKLVLGVNICAWCMRLEVHRIEIFVKMCEGGRLFALRCLGVNLLVAR